MMQFVRSVFVALLLGVVWPVWATAEDWVSIVRCGAFSGTAYYFERGVVTSDQSGWSEDKITSGEFSIMTNGSDFDVVFKDARGSAQSARFHQGGTIVPTMIDFSPGGFLLINIYYQPIGISSEQYMIHFKLDGRVEAVLTQQKVDLISKATIMRADCFMEIDD